MTVSEAITVARKVMAAQLKMPVHEAPSDETVKAAYDKLAELHPHTEGGFRIVPLGIHGVQFG